MTEPEFGIKITRDEEEQEYKYAVCIYLNPVIMDSLTYEQQRQFEELQKRNETLVSQCIDEIGDTASREKASQALDDYFKQITDYIHLAEKQYRAVTTTPEQVSRDIQSSIHNFSEDDYRQMRLVEEWEYEYIKEALIGINHPLIEYYKELTGDTTEIPEIFLSPIQEKAKQIYIDLQAALDRLKRNNKEPPKTPQYQIPPPKSKYYLISTDRGINAAFRLDTSKGNLGEFLPSKTDDLIYQTPVATLTISDFYKQLDPLHFSTAAKMVLATTILTYQQQKQKQLTLKYLDYMEIRGLSDRKAAREQLKAQLDLLWHTSITYDDFDYIPKINKNGKRYTKKNKVKRQIRLIQQLDFGRGYVTITLGDTFHERLQQIDEQNFLAPYPTNLLKLSTLEDFAFTMGDMFARLEKEQAGQSNYHKHAVSTILQECEFPVAEKLIADGERHLARKIIEPFDRALKRLVEIGQLTDYTYIEKDGNTADYSRLIVDYNYFITLNVCIETTAPDNSHLINSKKRAYKKKAI